MPELVTYLVIFVGLGAFFLLFHLLLGKLVRPSIPDREKLTIYECGEPTIGSAWVQFDLRYYVVALLFVIFDVEVAFFFPWAIVFGQANTLAKSRPDPANQVVYENDRARRIELTEQLGIGALPPIDALERKAIEQNKKTGIDPEAAWTFARIGFVDIMVFFGVLLVGFAYLWKRGDIEWVRSVRAESPEMATGPPPRAQAEELVGAGR